MANVERSQEPASLLETAKVATAKSLSLLQWTDLPCSVLAAQPSELIHSFCVQSEQAADLLITACQRTQEEAQNLRNSLNALKSQLAEKRMRDGEIVGAGDVICSYNSHVVSSLYASMETPVCYLTQASPLSRIIMKRRLFTYVSFRLRAKLVDDAGASYSFPGPITFRLHLFTSVVPSQEVVQTRRGALMLMGHTPLCTESPSEVVFKGVSFAEATSYLPQGTLTLVCSADTPRIGPLLLPGIRVRSLSRKLAF